MRVYPKKVELYILKALDGYFPHGLIMTQ